MAYLEFDRLSKAFPGVQALDDVSFSVNEGSVHALCGENGAGKSTLLKILSGVYRPDSGCMRFGGAQTDYSTPFGALQAGVAVIYQELHLVPEMSVAENIYLGHSPNLRGIVDSKTLETKTRESLRQVGVDIDPHAKVGSLPIAQRQMVEIAKALSRDAKIIAFDEPTSSLSAREVNRLFEIIAELKRQNRVVVYVTHRMEEIFRVCDAATVLRDGKHVETFESLEGVDANIIVNRMVGRSIEDIYGYTPRELGENALTVSDLAGPGLAEPASLSVDKGEIVGVFGLVGAGRTELLKAIYGDGSGTIGVDGNPSQVSSARASIRRGVMLCPEDRKGEGIIAMCSVKENVNLSARRRFSNFGFWINEREEIRNASRQVDRLGVRTPTLNQPIGLLSGGNQQKCVLARWLSEDVKVLLLDEPTRGIDVGAKREIYDIIYELAASGAGILLVSSDLSEVLGVSDRILVMRQGRIVADLLRGQADSETIMKLALPVAEESALAPI